MKTTIHIRIIPLDIHLTKEAEELETHKEVNTVDLPTVHIHRVDVGGLHAVG